MAIIGVPFSTQRPEYSERRYRAYPYKGQIRVGSWPRPRGPAKTTAEKQRQNWLASVVKAYKMEGGNTVANIREQASYQRLRPQDWYTHITSGRAYLIITREGKRIFPMRFVRLTSLALDQACAGPAALAVRYQSRWRGLIGGTTGAVLTMHGGYPQWSTGDNKMADPTPTAAAQNISDSLDCFGVAEGTMLMRGEDIWTAIPPGTEGQVLTIGDDGFPGWADA